MRVKRISRNTWITVGGFAVILAGFGLGGYLPYRLEYDRLTRDIQARSADRADTAVQSARLRDLTRQAQLIQAEVRDYDRLVPANKDLGNFLQDLSRELEASHLSDFSVRAWRRRTSASASSCRSRCTVRGRSSSSTISWSVWSVSPANRR